MKKYILALLIISVAISCKDFLEEQPKTTLNQDYYNTETGLDNLINGLYVYARIKHEWDASGARLIEAGTDGYQFSNVNQARYSSGDYGTDVSTIAGNINSYLGTGNATFAPIGAYPMINNCNIALQILADLKPGKFADDAYNTSRKAEILFLRSWAYYLISNQLGAVPLVLTAKQEDDGIYHYPKESLENIYKQIITDVRFAYANLPTSQTDRGRITKLAAGHFLAKLYLNRAQAATFQGAETHLAMLYKGNVATDLDSVITLATEVIGAAGGLAPDYAMLFDPKNENTPHAEILWSAQFDVNTVLNGRFGNRSVNYHVGNYADQTGVVRSQAYGRPFGTFRPTDWGYDNFRDKLNDSRYYKTFAYEYISNMATKSSSFAWNANAAKYWNLNKPAGSPTVKDKDPRILYGKRALIFIENQRSEALDSLAVMSQPYQFNARWIKSSKTGKLYYRMYFDGASIGLATARQIAPSYLSSKKWVDPMRGGSAEESNFDSEAGTRDAILMRLAETYLIRAEAYGRKGNYTAAVADINVLRQRASYKSGEARPSVAVEWEPKAATLPAIDKIEPYYVSVNTYPSIAITESIFTPATPEAIAEQYIPTVTSKSDMFIHFIYNEKVREFLSEGLAWEDQHNAGILYDRAVYLNQMASNKTGLWPVAANSSANGQNGNGKGAIDKFHTFRPWPNAYLSLLTDAEGNPLDGETRAAYQNPGYGQ